MARPAVPTWRVRSTDLEMKCLEVIVSLCFVVHFFRVDAKYEPRWESLDSRSLPRWYDEAKFGIFIHWGVFSVPSFGSEWFWQYLEEKRPEFVDFMQKRYKPDFTYQDFARDFTAEFFNASQWSELFEASGARYVVLTSKHHEGYAMWPSKYAFGWNAKDVGPHRDLVGEFAVAIKKSRNLKFGLYHSLFEWFNPLWLEDKRSNFASTTFVKNKVLPEMRELVETYEPEVFWSDGDAGAPDTYWEAEEFIAWLYNESPVKDTVVTNDRWGEGTACKHGDIYSCADRYNPGVLQAHKWENCMTIDRKSWGYRRNALLEDYMTVKDLIKELVTTVSCGGNLLMNVGPTKDGIIPPIFEERLRGIGQWLQLNGEAIYGTKPWKVQNDTLSGIDVWYTVGRNGNLYASVLSWPERDVLKLGAVQAGADTKISFLGSDAVINWKQTADALVIFFPRSEHRGNLAWVLYFENHV